MVCSLSLFFFFFYSLASHTHSRTNTHTHTQAPQKSKSLTKIRPKKISCNFFHGLALTSMNIYTWSMDHDLLGRNSIGYVGTIELPATFQRLSDEMSSDSDFVDISAGYSHSLAIDSSGKMISWGKMNNSVELSVMGQPADTGGVVLLPTQVMKFNIINKQTNVVETVNYDPNSPTTAITRISTFRFHSIAVSKDQTVYSWGTSTYYLW
jgi:alpha-tubulin suppressor-like RCC1 family protein